MLSDWPVYDESAAKFVQAVLVGYMVAYSGSAQSAEEQVALDCALGHASVLYWFILVLIVTHFHDLHSFLCALLKIDALSDPIIDQASARGRMSVGS